MTPNIQQDDSLHEDSERQDQLTPSQAAPRKYELVYQSILVLGYGHIAAAYGFYLCFTSSKWQSIVFALILAYLSEIGASVGAHRLWSHKAFKAKIHLEILLMFLTCLAAQKTVTSWVREHRLHHKHSDTDADPHNATRGLFYSHIGWLLVRKHPEVKKRGKHIDMSDIYNNPVLKFQKKYAVLLFSIVSFVLPTLIPIYTWEESVSNAWHIGMLRYIYSIHLTFLANSFAHIKGNKPYDRSIMATNNYIVAFFTIGEGFHNYHHVFPWDYRSAELGNNKWNIATWVIDFFAWIGWAYDLKIAPTDSVKLKAERSGDRSNLVRVKNMGSLIDEKYH